MIEVRDILREEPSNYQVSCQWEIKMLYAEVALRDRLISRLAERMSLVLMTAFSPIP